LILLYLELTVIDIGSKKPIYGIVKIERVLRGIKSF